MKRSAKEFMQAIVASLLLSAVMMHPVHPDTAEEDKDAVALSIRIDGASDWDPIPLIYVKGELVGAISGAIEIPLEEKGVPVEIGLSEIDRIPLYSFIFGPAELKNARISVAVTSFGFSEQQTKNVWSSVYLKPNESAELPVIPKANDYYEIVLPREPLRQIRSFQASREILPYSTNWYANIPANHDESPEGGVDHVFFNPVDKRTELLSERKDPLWSGAYTQTAFGEIGNSTQKTFLSDPTEARVVSDRGFRGVTVATLDIRTSEVVVLQKDGYFDLPAKKCKETGTKSSIEVSCKLKKRK